MWCNQFNISYLISYFEIPILQRKRSAFAIEDAPGLWRVHWQIKDLILLSTFYTRHDQACLLWGLISVLIFATIQFLPIDWQTQCMSWSVLTLLGTIGMVVLTHHWVKVEQLKWLLYTWAGLMLLGMVITDLSLLLQWADVLLNLCAIWLGLTAIGYGFTAWGMRSRAFSLVAILHGLGILLLPYVGSWKFLTTGLIIGGSVSLLAELQWDADGVCGNQPSMLPGDDFSAAIAKVEPQ